MKNKRSPKPWLRTLPNDEAAASLLAADLLDLTDHYTEVRQNDVGHETDLRVQIGKVAILDCGQMDTL